MVSSNRRGGSALAVRLLLLSCLLALPGTRAGEPAGDFRLQVERVPSSNGSVVVRLKIQPFTVVAAATLTVSAPLDFDLRPRTPSMHRRLEVLDGPGGETRLRARLSALESAAPSTLELELDLPSGSHGTLDFVVEGIDGKGRALRDAVGLSLPDPAARGTRRLGAHEYPAVILPDGGER